MNFEAHRVANSAGVEYNVERKRPESLGMFHKKISG